MMMMTMMMILIMMILMHFKSFSDAVRLPHTHSSHVFGTLFAACPTACPFRSYSGNFIQIGWIHKHRLHIRLHLVPTNFSESINVSLLFPRLRLIFGFIFILVGVEVVKFLVKTETGLKLLRVDKKRICWLCVLLVLKNWNWNLEWVTFSHRITSLLGD